MYRPKFFTVSETWNLCPKSDVFFPADAKMDDIVLYENHVLSVCNALGGYEGNSYKAGDEATDCLRDLKRFLRLDEEQKDRSTHLLLGKWKFAKTDLIPLLISSANSEKFKLAMGCIEVLVPLTWPTERALSPEENDIMMMYKSAFVNTD